MSAAVPLRLSRVAGAEDMPLPAYATAGAAGLDLRAFLPEGPLTLSRGDFALVRTGFRVELPPGVELQIRPRSGLALRHGLIVPNSPGTVDEDYRGEIMVGLMLLGPGPLTIAPGDRIAQAVPARVLRAAVEEADALSPTARGEGGFGSTGRG